MRRTILVLSLLTMPLAGCLQDPASRGLVGAGIGAAVADATGGDMLTGAVIGGLGGAATCGINLGLPACY